MVDDELVVDEAHVSTPQEPAPSQTSAVQGSPSGAHGVSTSSGVQVDGSPVHCQHASTAQDSAQPSPGVTTRAISAGPASGFAAGGGLTAALPPIPYRPAGPPTSPWAILLLPRADLPVTVEQRLFMH